MIKIVKTIARKLLYFYRKCIFILRNIRYDVCQQLIYRVFT